MNSGITQIELARIYMVAIMELTGTSLMSNAKIASKIVISVETALLVLNVCLH